MRRRTWDAKTKALIGLKGLKGRSVAERCPAHQISQSLSDQGRDQCLATAAQVFPDPQRPRKEARLAQEHTRRQPLVGDLTLE
jgi:hypothetical protein